MSKQGLTGWFVALGLLLGNAGCGDDDSGNNQPTIPSNNNTGDDNNNTGGSSDNNNTGGDNNNAGGDNDNTGGSGDNNNTGGDNDNTGGGGNPIGGGGFDLSCDDSVPTTATCGGVECPTPQGAGSPLCMVPCCVDDECGTRSANSLMPTQCRVPPKTDENCPPYEGMVMGVPVNLPGCCTPEGKCGVVSSLSMMCITTSPLIPDLPADPAPCTPN